MRRDSRPMIDEEETLLGDGAVARLADQILENPAKSGGLLVMALTACGIVSNAMFLQSGRHPDPLFMTRPAVAIETPRARPAAVARTQSDDAGPAVVADDMPPALPTPPPGKAMIANIQRGLAHAHFYSGPADGVAGSKTKAAIAAFQKSAGRDVDGLPSASLLDDIRAAAATAIAAPPKPVPAPVPAPAPAAKALPVVPVAKVAAAPAPVAVPVPVAKVAPPAPVPVIKVAPRPAPVAAQPAPANPAPLVPVVKTAALMPDPAAQQRERVRAVVVALNQIGYGPLKADGQLSSETEDAIRRFELDNGLAINGSADEAVIKRLVTIGAMKPI